MLRESVRKRIVKGKIFRIVPIQVASYMKNWSIERAVPVHSCSDVVRTFGTQMHFLHISSFENLAMRVFREQLRG